MEWDDLSPAPSTATEQPSAAQQPQQDTADWNSLSTTNPSQAQSPEWDALSPTAPAKGVTMYSPTSARQDPEDTNQRDLSPSVAGTAARRIGEGIFPTAASVAAATVGGEGGAALGALTGPLAPVASPVLGLAGAIAGGMGYGYLASKGQDWILDKLGLRSHLGLDEEQRAADAKDNPTTDFVAGLVPMAATMRPTAGLALKARAGAAAIYGGMEAGQEYGEGEDLNPLKIGGIAAAGAAFPGMKDYTAGKETPGKLPIPQPKPQLPTDPAKPNVGGAAAPVEGAGEDDLVVANDVTTTSRGVAAENPPAPEVSGAGNPVGAPMVAREAAKPSDPVRDYRKTGQGATAEDVITTAPSTKGVTLSDDPVNETLKAALPGDEGIPPFLQRTETGLAHPGPMEGAAPAPEPAAQPPAAQAAIQGQSPAPAPAPAPEPHVETGLAPPLAIPGIPTGDQRLVQSAVQRARRLGVQRADMPSIANSVKGRNGNVIVDTDVPDQFIDPLKVHETVEKTLMAEGDKYADTAHPIATQAEHAEVDRLHAQDPSYPDWPAYQKWFQDNGARIAQKPLGEGIDPSTLHADLNDPDVLTHHHGKGEPPAAPVTAAVTPEQQGHIDIIRDQLSHPELKEQLAHFDSMTPQEQAAVAKKGIDHIVAEHTAAKEAAARPKRGGVQINASRAERIDRSTAAIKHAINEFAPDDDKLGLIPTSPEDKEDLIGRLAGMVKSAADKNNGGSPLREKTGGYAPRKKPAEWSLLDQAEKLVAAKNPSDAAIAKFVADEKLLRQGGEEGAKEFQASRRAEADTDKQQFPVDAAAQEQMIAQDRALSNAKRDELPAVPDDVPGKDNSYLQAWRAAKDYVSGLTDNEYDHLARAYDIRDELTEPRDPAKLLDQFKASVATPRAAPGEKAAPITAAERTGANAEALGLNTDPDRFEAKSGIGKSRPDLIAAYNKRLAAGELKAPTGERAPENAIPDERTLDNKALAGSWDAAKENIKKFVTDEQGGAQTPPWLLKTAKSVKDVFSPDVDRGLEAANEEYGKSFEDVGKELHTKIPGMNKQMTERIKQDTAELRAAVQKASSFNMKPTEKRNLYRAQEQRNTSSLDPEINGYYQMVDKPLADELDRRVTAIKNLKEATGIGPKINLIGDGITAYVPHFRSDHPMFNEAENRQVMPTPENTLTHTDNNLKDRTLFALRPVDANGKEMPSVKAPLLAKQEDGSWKTATNKAIKGLPTGWGTALNEPLTLKTSNGTQRYVLDNPRVKELNAAGLKDKDGKPITFHENSTLALIQANHEAEVTLQKNRLFAEMQRLVDEHGLSTTSANEAVAKGWAPSASRKDLQQAMTTLPEFEQRGGRDQYFPPNLKWELDHIHEQGYTGPGVDQVTRGAQALLKTMFFTQPFIHAANVADNFFAARGFDNFRPSGWNPKTMIDAHKMILNGAADPNYRRWVMAGGNPMLRNVEFRDFAIKNAKALGEQMTIDPNTWDPIARKLGITAKELRRTIYDATQKPMWYMADTMSAHRFLENERLYGMSPEKAAQEGNNWLPTYHMPATIPALGQNKVSRIAAKIMNTPAFVAFGPYAYEKMATFGRMNKNLLQTPVAMYKQGKITRENSRALGQAIMMYAVLPALYMAADKGLQYATGDKNSSFTRRGVSQIPDMLTDVATHKKPLLTPLKEINPSIPASMLAQGGMELRDWAGKPITQEAASLPAQGGQAINWAAAQAIPPYSDFLQGLKIGHPVEHMLAGQVGAKIPSPAGSRYLSNQQKIDQRALKQYNKNSPF